jgi:hypothetical protein
MNGTFGLIRAACVKTLSETMRLCRVVASPGPRPGFAARKADPCDDRSGRNGNRRRNCAQASRRNPRYAALLIVFPLCFPFAALCQATTVPAALISPTPGGVLGSSATFTWTAGTGVTQYELTLGTSAGAYDVYNSGHITATSVTATGLPLNGTTVYA